MNPLPQRIRLPKDRADSRRRLDQLTTGERFMLLFGQGTYHPDPPRVLPKRPGKP